MVWRLYKLFKREKPDIIHTHLIDAMYVGQLAAWLAGVPMRVFTRWHADIHHRRHPHAIKYDRLSARLATHIVAAGPVGRRVMVELDGVDPNKITLIYPPFDLEKFANPPVEEVRLLKEKYNPTGRKPVIGVIARWIDWKGVQYIIPAVKRLLAEYPDLLLLLFNAKGPYDNEIRALLAEMPERNYQAVEFETMNTGLYQLFDVFVHTPISDTVENTGGVYTEALPAGVPSVFTLSGVIPGRVEHLRDCYIADYEDVESIYQGIKTILENPELAQKFRENGPKAIGEEFTIAYHIRQLDKLYGVS
jgi:glycosyltransferase involved in cell wall biosynthesis